MIDTLRSSATRTAAWLRSSEGVAAAGTAGALVAVELVGRRLPAEWAIAPAWLILGLVYRALRQRALGAELRWPTTVARRLRDTLQRALARVRGASFRGGADLRGEPALPRAVPGQLLALAVAPWVVVTMLLLAVDAPQRFVADLREHFFLLHAFLVGSVWIAAGMLTCGFAVLVLGNVHDGIYEPLRRRGKLRPEQEHALQTMLALGCTVFALATPAVLTLGIGMTATLLTAALLCLPLGADLAVAWHTAAHRELRTCSFLSALRLRTLCGAGLAVAIILAARGAPATLSPDVAAPLPFTAGLATLLAGWGAAASITALGMATTVSLARSRFARGAAAPVTLRRSDRAWTRTERRTLEAHGFALRRGRSDRRAGDVRVDADDSEALCAELEGVAERDPWNSAVARVGRKSERLHRRALLRGLMRAFNAARAEANPRVEGFWIGPQHWFERAVWSSGGEEHGNQRCFDSDLGPAYEKQTDWRTRAYFHRVCRGLAIDHVFVERGVGADSVRRALEMLFELDDIFGGRTRAEERHFRGIPGARILIHEQPGEPRWLPAGFPDPDHDELARARILHLFRDRGGELDDVSPRTPSRTEPLVGSWR